MEFLQKGGVDCKLVREKVHSERTLIEDVLGLSDDFDFFGTPVEFEALQELLYLLLIESLDGLFQVVADLDFSVKFLEGAEIYWEVFGTPLLLAEIRLQSVAGGNLFDG